jgi:hypothetical protein
MLSLDNELEPILPLTDLRASVGVVSVAPPRLVFVIELAERSAIELLPIMVLFRKNEAPELRRTS